MPLLRAGNLPEPISSHDIKPMEQFGQGYGSIMYSTTLPSLKAGSLLRISDMCDYAIVYVGDEELGRLYRGNGYETTLRINQDIEDGTPIDIYIEAMGRINYSKLINDPKGITHSVEVITSDGKNELTYNLKDWQVRLFPLAEHSKLNDIVSDLSSIPLEKTYTSPAYYKSTFKLTKTGDTYLDLSTWGKGLVWVNGHCLGRFWNIGPQQTLFLPGCWLKKGQNEIIVLDIAGATKATIRGLKTPIIDQLHREYLPNDAVKIDKSKRQTTTSTTQNTSQGNDAAPGAK